MIPITGFRSARSRALLAALGSLAALGLAVGCGSSAVSDSASSTSAPPDGRPLVVVTHPVLGAVVSDLVGDGAHVEVLIPPGVDPHDYEPSARDAEALTRADLVVVNGGLEERLAGVVEQAESSGMPVFAAIDHVDVRHREDADHDHDDVSHDDASHDAGGSDIEGDHHHGAADPHFWVDPVAMADVVRALGPVVDSTLGVDVAARSTQVVTDLTALDQQVRQRLSPVPPERRLLVTAHESLGYFADRYGLELLGALVPSLTSQANPSAADLAELAEELEHHHVPAIFLEIGTSPALARAMADQTGVRVVELDTHTLPDSGSYAEFIMQIASGISEGLAP